MDTKDAKSLFFIFFKTLGSLFLLLYLGLYFDSIKFNLTFKSGQNLLTLMAVIGFIILFYNSVWRIRELMIYAVIIGVMGEHLFSIGMDMYTYRLGIVPLYVPLGHSIVYIAAIYFVKMLL